jgi:hypothetical protein
VASVNIFVNIIWQKTLFYEKNKKKAIWHDVATRHSHANIYERGEMEDIFKGMNIFIKGIIELNDV